MNLYVQLLAAIKTEAAAVRLLRREDCHFEAVVSTNWEWIREVCLAAGQSWSVGLEI